VTIGCASYKLSRLKSLESVIGQRPTYVGQALFGFNRAHHCDEFVGWGYGVYAKKALQMATHYNKPFSFLEDGFLRSPFVSSISKAPYGLVKDSKAAYYDYSVVTDLETLICTTALSGAQKDKAELAINFFVTHKLGKFAITNDKQNTALPKDFGQNSLLLIDQVAGDLSLHYGGVTSKTAQQAYEHIKENYPDQKIYLKLHPEVLAGKKQGCFDFCHTDPDIICVTDCDLPTLLSQGPQVFVLTSLAGFEGLLHQCNVTTFGLPWYCGYGLTHDYHPDIKPLRDRRKTTDIYSLFHAAYIDYTHYIDPMTQQRLDIFTIMHFFARIKRHVNMMQGHILAIGIRPWKKKDFYPWVKTPYNQVSFCGSYADIKQQIEKNPQTDFKLIVWGYYKPEIIKQVKCTYPKLEIMRIEDGFLRSYGLGSDFFAPLSLCIDSGDLHFHAQNRENSDFHTAIRQSSCHDMALKRVQDFVKIMHDNRISKYNVEPKININVPKNKHIIFVSGQVSGDASLNYGGLEAHLKDDFGLLSQVRKDYPASYILYKPHPDVTQGNRKKSKNDIYCEAIYDQKIIKISIIDCIQVSDMTATLTSQTGFDALIRGKKVHCYGNAFYKNYGLCANDTPQSQAISLDNFIHAALIDYPIYQYEGQFILPEAAINIIIDQKQGKKDPLRHIIMQSIVLRYMYKAKKWLMG
jgi:capsular polysaccharide export protein